MAEDIQITQWEYKYVDTDEKTLNYAGKNGWEVIGQPTGSRLLVKRPKKNNWEKESKFIFKLKQNISCFSTILSNFFCPDKNIIKINFKFDETYISPWYI